MSAPTNEQLRSDSDMGVYAAQVLSNPAWAEAWARIQADIYARWLDCPVHETGKAQLIHQQGKMLDAVRGAFVGMIEQGKLAGEMLKRATDAEAMRTEKPESEKSPIERDLGRSRRRRVERRAN